MGYACPVCDDPQQDAEHLANHLAFQALTHGGDHESWLDDHAPGWAEGGPADLAPRLTALAEDAEYEVVFADTTGERGDGERYDPDLQGVEDLSDHGHGHDGGGTHGHGHSHDHRHRHAGDDGIDVSNLDPETRDVVEAARSLTREMLEEGADDAADEGEDADDGADE
jgi:hypothetical protein